VVVKRNVLGQTSDEKMMSATARREMVKEVESQ
jgi:hypothetical protein